MSKKGTLKERGTGEVIYPVTLKACILDAGVGITAASGTELSAREETYYRFDEPVDTLAIHLEDEGISDKTAQALEVCFTTGDRPAVTISSKGGRDVEYFQGFSIEPNTTYELNIMFNGRKWIVAYAVVE